METYYVVALLIVLAALLVLLAVVLRPRGRIRLAVFVLALALCVLAACMVWKQAILVLAILSVCTLGVATMFHKITPRQALTGAVTGFTLIFLFTWLARKLADLFLYERSPDLPHWNLTESTIPLLSSEFVVPMSYLLAPIGLACLLVAVVARKAQAVWLFAGMVLVLLAGPEFLRKQGSGLVEGLPVEPWVVALGLILLVLAVAIRVIAVRNRHEMK